MYSGEPEFSVQLSREAMLAALDPAADLTLVVVGSAPGDDLAAAGARALLAELPYRELEIEQLACEGGHTALLAGCGFSRVDHEISPRALAIAEMRFERVIVLPSSFDLSVEAVHDALVRTRAVIFAREPESAAWLAPLCDVRLAHDCAFFADLAADGPAWLEQGSREETVRTDLARVMIGAALTGRRVEYEIGRDPGIDAVARHSLAGYPVSPAAEPRAGTKAAGVAARAPRMATSLDSRVCAVVLTRDRPEAALRAVDSLRSGEIVPSTTVIDNNSGQHAAHILDAALSDVPGVQLRRLDRNLGCAGGRNLGLESAGAELVLFLDDDAELMPGAVGHLVDELERHPQSGAVTATILRADGTVFHSGGAMEVGQELVRYELLGDGLQFSEAALPPSGPSGWVPGGAFLARRSLLRQFPMDPVLGYFEDNDWSYRVARAYPGSFRRSREAIATHHAPAREFGRDFASRARVAELLASYARFYQLHGLLLGPWLFDHVPELRAGDGSCDLAAARILMELVLAKGTDWILMSWLGGELAGLLSVGRLRDQLRDSARQTQEAEAARDAARRELDTVNRRALAELQQAQDAIQRRDAELERLRRRVAADAHTVASLNAKVDAANRRLRRVEGSVTWQVFQRLRRRLFEAMGGEASPGVQRLQSALRWVGRRLAAPAQPDSIRAAAFPALSRVAPPRGSIELTRHECPAVSIVIPLYGQAQLTAAALESIRLNTPESNYEVILVDDCSDTPTQKLLERVRGAHVIANETNIGYLRSVQRGAAAAQGRWLLLCNNDIEVQPGWLTPLLECGESADDIAIVVPKYLYPDGSLAEAGAVIWRDATGANYGRRQDPACCHYEFRREVDYGSAAAMLVRSDFWREVGGFDARFLPMYYEDTDLCFEARRHGLRVLYEPRSRVIHLEGGTAGVDENVGHKRNQELNRPKFLAKWREVLEDSLPPNDQGKLWEAANRLRRPHVLIADHRVPTWDRDSGGLRMRGIIDALLELGCHVVLLPDNLIATEPYCGELQRLGVEVLYGVDPERALERIGPSLSLAILSRPRVASNWLKLVRELAPAARVAYDTVDLHWLREARAAGVTPEAGFGTAALPLEAREMHELELALIRAADCAIVVSDRERQFVQADVPDAVVHVIPNVNPVRRECPEFEQRRGILFVGGFEHPPNVDAALTLVHDVMPLVWEQLGDVAVTIVGADAPAAVQALASPLVDVRGWVAELDPILDAARVMLAPLRYGAGLKGKVTQALAAGLPVVTTDIGAEGLEPVDGEHLLLANHPRELAEQTLRLLTDGELWERVSASGRSLMAQLCSPQVVSQRLSALLDPIPSVTSPSPVSTAPPAAPIA